MRIIVISPFKSIFHSLACCAKLNAAGRIGRLDFFWFILFELFVFCLVSAIADNDIVLHESTTAFLKYFFLSFLLFAMWIMAAGFIVMAKRWHDIGRSGWYNLLMCIPIFNTIVAVYLLLKPGTLGVNQYGEAHSWGVR